MVVPRDQIVHIHGTMRLSIPTGEQQRQGSPEKDLRKPVPAVGTRRFVAIPIRTRSAALSARELRAIADLKGGKRTVTELSGRESNMHPDLEVPNEFQPGLWPVSDFEIWGLTVDSEANAARPAAEPVRIAFEEPSISFLFWGEKYRSVVCLALSEGPEYTIKASEAAQANPNRATRSARTTQVSTRISAVIESIDLETGPLTINRINLATGLAAVSRMYDRHQHCQ
jgi:hypothetical protein